MTAKRLLLHACCGPCLLHPERRLSLDWEITVFFVNPNVHPRWEWGRRRQVLVEYCEKHGMEVVTEAYGPNVWSRRVLTGDEDPVPIRCRRCYALRLDRTAERAAADGYDAFSSTLLVSPYQDHESVVCAGMDAEHEYGIRFLAEDFRDGYKWGVGRAKQHRMYRQNYCGCVLSLVERGQARRLPRKKAKRTGV